ncbi:hypothetical protein [uncultured Ruegeria sp.]|uniref:hypothetical protein n=1 Tax=uncultured Ruegeria sp. TaxID=259304 RepID=UPI0026053813|nr:hypothetical protein [uncultured Ruegeria sp.]
MWADSPLGEVRITLFGGKWFHKGECFGDDPDAAKAAAQADYQRRYTAMSALTQQGDG